MSSRGKWWLTGTIVALAIVAGIARHLHSGPRAHSPHVAHGGHAQSSQPETVDIQGTDEWKHAPQMRAYYEEKVATFANGPDIDVDAYEARSFDIFREFARANGMDEAGMVDHVKLIPRQVVGIVKEDPTVLKDFDSFWAALAGPE